MKSIVSACALMLMTILSPLAPSAGAQTVVAEYGIDDPNVNGVSLNFFQFGYTNVDGDFIPLTGNRIESSTVRVNFRPGLVDDGSGNMVPFDVTRLEISMVVPVLLDDPNGTELFQVTGDQLVQTSPGTYAYELTTNAFNGEIRTGRFSLDIEAFDDMGEPAPIAGELFGGSGFFYTVAIPEPAMMGVIPIALTMLRRRVK